MASKLLITPYNGSTTAGQDPTIKFRGTGNSTDITLRVAADGNLSFEGTAGQLMSITNSLTGTLFAVNDISGIPSIEVLDTGLVKINEFNGNLQIGGTTNTANQVTFKGTTDSTSITTGAIVASGGVAVTKNLYAGGSLVAASGTTGAGYFGLGTVLSSGAGANDTTLRWDGSSGNLRFSYGTSIVGTMSSAGHLTVNGGITASSGTIYGATYTAAASAAYGYGLWAGAPLSYGILMSDSANATYGGRMSGETTSDYNMYFSMSQGTNRGFVFRNAYATPLFAINGDAVRSNVALRVLPSGITDPVHIGNWSNATTYGMITFNGLLTYQTYLGIGGNAATGSLYYNTNSGSNATHYFRVAGTDVATLNTTSFTLGSGNTGASHRPYTGGSYAAIYNTNITPDNANYSLAHNGARTFVNGVTNVDIAVNGVNIISATGTGAGITGSVTATGGIDKLTTATGVVSVAAATAPTSGQVLTATSGTTATWQTPSAGTDSITTAVTAAGTVQGNATVLTTTLNNVTTVAAGTGVILPTTAAGLRIVVRNGGANTLKVYPTGTTTINAGGAGVAFSLAVGGVLEFIAMSSTTWYTVNGTYI